MTAFPGSSPAKDKARELLYKRVGEILPSKAPQESLAVILAGYDAPEIPYLRELGWPLEGILVVDRSEEAIARAYCREPWVNFFRGELKKYLRKYNQPIGFIHLDLMGTFNHKARKLAALALQRLCKGGVLAYTFLAARESPALGAEVLNALDLPPEESLPLNHFSSLDRARFTSYSNSLQAISPNIEVSNQLVPILALRYNSPSPMGVIALQRRGIIGRPPCLKSYKKIKGARRAPADQIEVPIMERE